MNKTFSEIDAAIQFNRLIQKLSKIPLIKKLIPPYIYGDYDKKESLAILVKTWAIIKNIFGKIVYIALVHFLSQTLSTVLPETVRSRFLYDKELFYLTWVIYLGLGTYRNAVSNVNEDTKIKLVSFRSKFSDYYRYTLKEFMIDRALYLMVLVSALLIMKAPLSIIIWSISMVILAKLYAELSEVSTILKKGFVEPNLLFSTVYMVLFIIIPIGLWFLTSFHTIMISSIALLVILNAYYYLSIKDRPYMYDLEIASRHHINKYDESQLTLQNIGLQGIETDELDVENYDVSQIPNKKGYNLYNAIFMQRHKKLWFKPLRNTMLFYTVPMLVLTVVYLIMNYLNLTQDIDLSGATEFYPLILKIYLFSMYFVNLGEKLAKAFYLHGDYSLLHYSFYKRKENIWKQYLNRLKTVSIINLLPASIIVLFLTLWYFMIPEVFDVNSLKLTLSSILLIAIFFSIHSLSLYYLIQPFNKKLEAKSVVYSVLNFGVYIFVINAQEVFTSRLGVLIVGLIVISYFIISVILVRLFSYKTFTWKD